jgi:rRNA small subunit pseudouridine methyltransferase Nep1
MLNIVFVETSLELVPHQIHRHPSVKRNAKKRGKKPEETLLDRSLHHFGMHNLPWEEKRGRPDIIQICLLEALGSPLNRLGNLRVWINTLMGNTIIVHPETRLPRDCNRFKSLIEQVFQHNECPPNSPNPLLKLQKLSLKELLDEIEPSKIIALTSHGIPTNLEKLVKQLTKIENPVVFIGAYPNGPMEPDTLKLADEHCSIYHEVLESWTVTSRLVYEFEKNSGIF